MTAQGKYRTVARGFVAVCVNLYATEHPTTTLWTIWYTENNYEKDNEINSEEKIF